MTVADTIWIGVGLSMDAVAVITGLSAVHHQKEEKTPFYLDSAIIAAFHYIMPLAGWVLCYRLRDFVGDVDHWLALFILSALGIKAIHEALKKEGDRKNINVEDPKVILPLAVALSMDAFITGASFAFLQINVLRAAAIIGITALTLCVAAIYIGRAFGRRIGSWAGITGGIILVLIGLKMFLEHVLH